MGTSEEQWRPCSDKYYPTIGGPAQTWPVTYIHNTGPPASSPTGAPAPSGPPPSSSGAPYPSDPPPLPSSAPYPSGSPPSRDNDGNNGPTTTTTEHVQTLIDQFLSIFKSSSETTSTSRPSVSDETPSASTPQHVHQVNGHADLLPGFRVVDVTDKPAVVANRLYSNGAGRGSSNRFTAKRKPFVYYVQ